MKGEQLIIQLLMVKEQYKYKPCYTGEVNIPNMIDDMVSEINRLTSKNAHDEHYIELGKAVEKAFRQGYDLIYNTDVLDQCDVKEIYSKKDLLKWAGRSE